MSATALTSDARVSRSTDFVVGLLCGAAAGAVAGLLMATKPGKELRTELADSAERFHRRMAESYHQASDAMAEAVDKGRESFRKGRESFDEARARYDVDTPLDAAADHRF